MLSALRRGLALPLRRRRAAADPELLAFLDAARRSFVCVQQAWDRADMTALARLATGPLVEELRLQLSERGPAPNHTEVLRVDARLLALEDLRDAQVASIEFTGLIRERQCDGPRPFRELWMLTRPPGDSADWRLARVQALS